jgi:hypothetical protein
MKVMCSSRSIPSRAPVWESYYTEKAGLLAQIKYFKTMFKTMNVRTLATTASLREAWYRIGDQERSLDELRRIPAEDRTVAEWQPLIDWDLQKQKPYVVLDPLVPTNLLYLSFSEYQSVVRTFVNNDIRPTVLAHPKTPKPTLIRTDDPNHSQNSPLFRVDLRLWDKRSRASWKSFLELNNSLSGFTKFARGTKMVLVTTKTVERVLLYWMRESLHYSGVDKPMKYLQYLVPLVNHVKHLIAHNGLDYTVKTLKISLFTLYNHIAGNPMKSTVPLGVGIKMKGGLPAILGPEIRSHIGRDIQFQRAIACIYNIYKALYAKHKAPDLSTITAQPKDFEGSAMFTEFSEFCKNVFPSLIRSQFQGKFPWFTYKTGLGHFSLKAGPNTSVAIDGLILDAKAWFQRGNINWVKTWLEFHGDKKALELFDRIADEKHWGEYGFARGTMSTRSPIVNLLNRVTGNQAPSRQQINSVYHLQMTDGKIEVEPRPILGRLHAIEEAAGKVRVVAIADYWTQMSLQSVHSHLFKLLAAIHTDATFDQEGRVVEYFKRGLSPHWSFDLKSATDLIPIALYREVLRHLLIGANESQDQADKRVSLWIKILTDRDWLHPNKLEFVRYTCGQPMGALSSWGSMALVHHALVQFAAYKVTNAKQWYGDYLVLGDDVDIATDARIASMYQEVCSAFGIVIGLQKSLHSEKNCFEFANQRFGPGGNISPLSVKELISSKSWMSRLEFAKRIVRRYYPESENQERVLLRSATTSAMWSAMALERANVRSPILSNLLRYCLSNPLVRSTDKLEVSRIWSWLAAVLDKETVVSASSLLRDDRRRVEIEQSIVDRLRTDVVKTVSKVLRDTPGNHQFQGVCPNLDSYPSKWKDRAKMLKDIGYLSEPSPEFVFPRAVGLLVQTQEGSVWNPQTGKWGPAPKGQYEEEESLFPFLQPASCRVAWAYYNYLITAQNERILLEAAQLQKKLPELSKRSKVRLEGTPLHNPMLLREWVDLWIEAHSLSKPYIFNVVLGSKYSFYEVIQEGRLEFVYDPRSTQLVPRVTDLWNMLFGPMREISSALAEGLGVSIPNISFFNKKEKGYQWMYSIRKSLKIYADRLEAQSRSALRELRLYERMYNKLFNRPSSPSQRWPYE